MTKAGSYYWDNLELEPIAILKGKVSRIAHGYLYHYQKQKFQPQIKFPVVEVNGCVSFDFLPLGVVLIVYFAVRLSILVKSLIDEPIDSRQDGLPAVIDSNCDSGSNK